jgi:hypothetical protein
MPQAEAGGIGPAGLQFQHKLPSLDLRHRARDGFTLNAGRMIDFPPKQRILHLCWPFGHNLHLAAVCCLWSGPVGPAAARTGVVAWSATRSDF